jgi:hypothetical protein
MSTKQALASGVMALLLVGGSASCSSTRAPEPLWNSWAELAEPTDSGGASYDARILAQRWRELEALRSETLELDARIASLSRAFRFRPVPRVSQDLLDRASWMMLRQVNARDALLSLQDFFASATPDDSALRVEGGLLGLHAGIFAARLDTRLVLLVWGNEELMEALDAASPALGVESGTFRAIHSETTAPRILDQMRIRRSLLDEALAREESALQELLAKDPTLAARHQDAMRAYDDALIQAQLVLYRHAHPAPDSTRSAQPGRFARWWDRVGARMGRDAYSTQGFVFTKVARIKHPRAQLLVFSSEDVRELRGLLRPGDLILTFTDGYVGNLFLPGVFKHGIIYVGSPEERTAAGLTGEALWKRIRALRQFERLKDVTATVETREGRPADVVESLAEGVKFSSLEHLLATHVNRMAILRPRISQQERLEMLVAVFAYVGLQYDFNFDFMDASRLYCTEMVYRVLEGKGDLHFEVTKTRGRWAVTADDIARFALAEPPEPLEVIALADRSPEQTDWDATLVTGAEARAALRRLMLGSADKKGIRDE